MGIKVWKRGFYGRLIQFSEHQSSDDGQNAQMSRKKTKKTERKRLRIVISKYDFEFEKVHSIKRDTMFKITSFLWSVAFVQILKMLTAESKQTYAS